MQSHLQPQDADRQYQTRRRGHVPQISISDDNHHVTEAIGDLYGDYNEWGPGGSRPNSYIESRQEEEYDRKPRGSASLPQRSGSGRENPPTKSTLGNMQSGGLASGALPNPPRSRASSLGSLQEGSPTTSLARSPSTDTANQAFPLNDIDYESSPQAVAQEISNLQAIRRMSMNVDAADPDLPAFGSSFSVPATPPSPSSGEDDASRLFWVPARLHPELAPRDYKSFVEDRVDRIRRGSGNAEDALSPDGIKRRGDSLNRRRSMLHKTIEDSNGYQDGADLLERKRSSGHSQQTSHMDTTLQELETLVNDPEGLVRKVSIDSPRESLDSINEMAGSDDAPVLPAGGQSLKRSTRTNYRRGSLNKGQRLPYSNRMRIRRPDLASHEDQADGAKHISTPADIASNNLARTTSEPPPPPQRQLSSERYDPSSTYSQQPASLHPSNSLDDIRSPPESPRASLDTDQPSRPHPRSFTSRIASNGRTTARVPATVSVQNQSSLDSASSGAPPAQTQHSTQGTYVIPERTSSQEYNRTYNYASGQQPRTSSRQSAPVHKSRTQTLDDMANSPSAMPGTNTSTDALSFIPTFTEGIKPEKDKKTKDRKDSSESGGKKASWNLFSRNDSKDRDKRDRDEQREEKEASRKSKPKLKSDKEKSYETSRLDVLSASADVARGRESLVLDRDRDSFRLEEERKKESNRKSNESKKEPGLFSSLFGVGKKKADAANKKRETQNRGLSPEPPRLILRPDIDYNWTRFSIMEERAIYRMAHIKLANPRRALHSQVLLSNFMYSYLAKVQQMHLIPAFIQQKNLGIQEPVQQPPQPSEAENHSRWQQYQEVSRTDRQQAVHTEADRVSQNHHDGPADQRSMSEAAKIDRALHETYGRAPDGPNDNGSSFIEDYDPAHQQSQDMAAAAQHQYMMQHQHQEHQEWEYQDHYTQQGLFGDSRPQSQDDMW